MLKISGFLTKQKMRLRTFDGGGNIAKSGAECLTPRATFKRLATDIKDQSPDVAVRTSNIISKNRHACARRFVTITLLRHETSYPAAASNLLAIHLMYMYTLGG